MKIDVPHALYRIFNKSGELLYAGVTLTVAERMAQHRKTHEDWHSVARIELTWYPNRADALAAETEAIRTERPLWNGPGSIRYSGPLGKAETVMKWVYEQIHSGALRPGERIPTTTELVRQFNSCPGTVRRAVYLLAARGVLSGHQGVGVFVAERPAGG